jgi:hypothetical protein
MTALLCATFSARMSAAIGWSGLISYDTIEAAMANFILHVARLVTPLADTFLVSASPPAVNVTKHFFIITAFSLALLPSPC